MTKLEQRVQRAVSEDVAIMPYDPRWPELFQRTFGGYLDFHPQIHALVADGLFAREALPPQPSPPATPDNPPPAGPGFHPLPETPLKPLEELFRAKVFNLLVEEELLPVERVRVLYSWKHSGFNVHAGQQVPLENWTPSRLCSSTRRSKGADSQPPR